MFWDLALVFYIFITEPDSAFGFARLVLAVIPVFTQRITLSSKPELTMSPDRLFTAGACAKENGRFWLGSTFGDGGMGV